MPDRKCDDNANFSKAELVSALQQQYYAGIDVALDDTPLSLEADKLSQPPTAPNMPLPMREEPYGLAVLSPRAADDLAGCSTLEQLKDALAPCEGCALKKTASNLVFADGNQQADVMIIGEAPGGDEDRMGLPFVGAAGQLLDKMLVSIGLRRSDVYITNILPWRPPGNRTPSPEEMQMLKPFLLRHIELKQPKLILALGGSSAKLLLDTSTGIMKLRGKLGRITTPNGTEVTVLPSLHPAYLLRAPAMKKLSYQDLLKLKSLLSDAVK